MLFTQSNKSIAVNKTTYFYRYEDREKNPNIIHSNSNFTSDLLEQCTLNKMKLTNEDGVRWMREIENCSEFSYVSHLRFETIWKWAFEIICTAFLSLYPFLCYFRINDSTSITHTTSVHSFIKMRVHPIERNRSPSLFSPPSRIACIYYRIAVVRTMTTTMIVFVESSVFCHSSSISN